jgi:multidrug efflux pump subunit AcrA (membrane-fusion protein)
MLKKAMWVLLSLLFTVIGLGGGWFAARQTSTAGGEAKPKDEHKEGDGHDEGAGHAEISSQALLNLGVTFKELEATDFSRTTGIPAVVESPSATEYPVASPVAGRVLEVRIVNGGIAAAGEIVVTVLRDALPFPELILTADIVQPASEQFHGAVTELRKARRNLDLLKTELARLEKFAESGTVEGYPIVPRKNLIDLSYEIARAEKDLLNSQLELRRHGLSDPQIAAVEDGKPGPLLNERFWTQALEQNGLWTKNAQLLHDVLPEGVHDVPRVIATIGELSATGLITPEFVEWLKANPSAAPDFLFIAALLQKGNSLRQVQYLHDIGALAAVVEIRAPRAVEDYDVEQLLVKPGEHVEAGARVALLRDPRPLLLKAEAAGGDAALLLKSLSAGDKLDAVPLVAGTGPDMTGLQILYGRNDPEDAGTVAVLGIRNEPLVVRAEEGGMKFRTWKLRPGQRFLLKVPIQSMKGVYVLPSDAVVEEGADRIVFVKDGDGVKPAKVVVLWQDREVVVLDSKNSEVFPGDEVAEHNAFPLRLALKAGAGEAAGGHAGHNH